jgi:hypothetical protein
MSLNSLVLMNFNLLRKANSSEIRSERSVLNKKYFFLMRGEKRSNGISQMLPYATMHTFVFEDE